MPGVPEDALCGAIGVAPACGPGRVRLRRGGSSRLSEAVNGRYYVAKNPADIGNVFIDSFMR